MPEHLPERDGVGQPPGVPRWVKAFGFVAALVVIFVIVVLLLGHVPRRHA
jgi:hypothetical protein